MLVLSLEMSKEQLVQRLLCSEARVDSHKVRTGYLDPRDWTGSPTRRAGSRRRRSSSTTRPRLTVLEARAKARRMKAEHGLDLIVIDYLQLMRGAQPRRTAQQEISEISRSLKALAKELNVPGGRAVPALPRGRDPRSASEPQLSRPARVGRHRAGRRRHHVPLPARALQGLPVGGGERVAEVIIGKQRNGPTGNDRGRLPAAVRSLRELWTSGDRQYEALLIGRPALRPRGVSMASCACIRLKRLFVGTPLPTAQARHERLAQGVTALAVFSSDALSSVAYATEEILLVLVLAGRRP